MLMSDWMDSWIELDQQWLQRSQLLFQRSVKEPNITKAQIYWYRACLSMKNRLEWKDLFLDNKDQEQEELLKAFLTC